MALPGQFAGEGLTGVIELVGDDDRRAFAHETTRIGQAHAGGGAGDDGDFVVEAHGYVAGVTGVTRQMLLHHAPLGAPTWHKVY
jgi:hypothetical protein